MATAVAVQSAPDFGSAWQGLSPKAEAAALFGTIGKYGTTVESIRELIAVPPEVEKLLRAYAEKNPEDREDILRVLEFRAKVGLEFERLHAGTKAAYVFIEIDK